MGCNKFKNLGTPMERYEYINLRINIISEEIIIQYNLRAMNKDGYVYADIRKVMHIPPQAGQISIDLLTTNLTLYGYYHCWYTPVIWRHKWILVILFNSG